MSPARRPRRYLVPRAIHQSTTSLILFGGRMTCCCGRTAEQRVMTKRKRSLAMAARLLQCRYRKSAGLPVSCTWRTAMGQSRNVSLVEVVVVVLMLVFLLSMVDGLFPTKPHQSARRSVCAANLKGLGTALAMYAAQARGSFPLASTARMRDSGSPEKGLHARPTRGRS